MLEIDYDMHALYSAFLGLTDLSNLKVSLWERIPSLPRHDDYHKLERKYYYDRDLSILAIRHVWVISHAMDRARKKGKLTALTELNFDGFILNSHCEKLEIYKCVKLECRGITSLELSNSDMLWVYCREGKFFFPALRDLRLVNCKTVRFLSVRNFVKVHAKTLCSLLILPLPDLGCDIMELAEELSDIAKIGALKHVRVLGCWRKSYKTIERLLTGDMSVSDIDRWIESGDLAKEF
ncbi:hypothetical protein AJ80_01945 [Polytolypa hystricis UAMH7299]|uniref:Uncharacterized protein n=1 Tax=Polytolypa hystricis (strain UAMH7299) TaxID=1447883 RepID=A0A2B7Z0U7_POLH7|nr:hypothetical protein AJ80_01945 [Polytolypa hystricis UAMH7299]